jgi:Trypsin-like peptidase domain
MITIQSWADCSCSNSPLQTPLGVEEIALVLNKSNLCSPVKIFEGSTNLPMDTEMVKNALMQTTHMDSTVEEQILAFEKDIKDKKPTGLSGFFPEGNSFFVKGTKNEVHLLTAKHVTDNSAGNLGNLFYVANPQAIHDTKNPIQSMKQFIYIESGSMKKSSYNDFVVLDSERFASFSDRALAVRSFRNQLLIDEPTYLVGYQQNQIKVFQCKYKGVGSDDFSKGRIEQYFKCDTKGWGLGGISGGAIVDTQGKAVAVFDGTIQNNKAPAEELFVRGTPIFQSADGKIVENPEMINDDTCVTCFSINDPVNTAKIFADKSGQRQSCILRKNSSGQSMTFEVVK